MFRRALTELLYVNKYISFNRYLSSTNTNYKLVQFVLSDIGEGIREVTVSDWYVKVGDKVAQFEKICSVESDKASVNITSRYDGVITKLYYEAGSTALVGKPLVEIDTPEGIDDNDSSASSDSDDEVNVVPSRKSETEEVPKLDNATNITHIHKALATPAVRRIAMENNINIADIEGTGKGGRVMKEDILNYLSQRSEKGTNSLIPSSQEETLKPIIGVKKVMFNTMTKSNLIPAFNFYEEVNVTKLVKLRGDVKDKVEEMGIKLSYMPFFIKAMSKALEKYPEINASIDENGENLIIKSSHNIGFAVDTPSGLIVPNIKNVQSLSPLEVAKEMGRILLEGKQGMFKPHDLSGGTITISNVGMIGGTYTRPLILPPELVIVALGKIDTKPVYDKDGELKKANVLYSSWSADHRVIDGATLARFVTLWKGYLENPSLLMLDV